MSIKEEIKTIELEITELQVQITSRRKRIDDLRSNCQHAWQEPKLVVNNHVYGESHYCGSYESRRWERECEICGKVETTYKENFVPVPDFESNYGKITFPNFGR